MKFRKKPVVIEAFQWVGDLRQSEPPVWVVDAINKCWGESGSARIYYPTPVDTAYLKEKPILQIFTLEGVHNASIGDYIIQGVQGELYPCKPDIFVATYEEGVE